MDNMPITVADIEAEPKGKVFADTVPPPTRKGKLNCKHPIKSTLDRRIRYT
ncbi:hypothetical protein RchiOBHm_Chr5g0027961 [Rosa chinensis]|uniref:Uncharacterized protein n=1 Tax=Rosa chinensis TaxID=74649 RepID=A0A2P6Q989_ROSCH|nr:hypothetical protein RchiOBHm_Chr5g0027961 [Rosa chinensis]